MIILSIIFLALLGPLKTHAQAPACQLAVTKTPSGEGRVIKINFPDGREMTVVGHIHGRRANQSDLIKLSEGKEFLSQSKEILERFDSKRALVHYKEDIEILRESLNSNKPQFVAVEMSQSTLQGLASEVKNFDVRMHRQILSTGNPDYSHFNEASLLAGAGAPLFLYHREPQLFRQAQILGLEDEAIIQQDQKSLEQLSVAMSELQVLAKDDADFIKYIANKDWQMMLETYPAFNFNDSRAANKLIQQELTGVPDKYKQAMQKYLEAYIQYFNTLNLRDHSTAESMLGQGQSGIIFIGAVHAVPIANKLKQACEATNQQMVQGPYSPYYQDQPVSM